jgi:hypothetical protein
MRINRSKFFYRKQIANGVYGLLLILVILLFPSCRKVIDVDIEGVEAKYVVEAVITDQPGDSRVLLSTTKDVSENNNFCRYGECGNR